MPPLISLSSLNHKAPLFLQNLHISFDHKKSEFFCSIIDNPKYPDSDLSSVLTFSLPILDCEDLKSGFSNEKFEKFRKSEFSLKGLLNPGLSKIGNKGNKAFLEKNGHFLILDKGSKRIELSFLCLDPKLSENVQKTLFLLCLQKEEKLACFSNPELFFLKRGDFRLPFVEPSDYLIFYQEKQERMGFLELLTKFKDDNKALKEAFSRISRLLYEFLLNGFAFLNIEFDDFVIFKGKLGLRLINPQNLIYWEGELEELKDIMESENLALWAFFNKLVNPEKISINKANFSYFLLIHSYFKWKYQENEDFETFFREKINNPEENEESVLFSLFLDKPSSNPYDFLSFFPNNSSFELKNPENPLFYLESPSQILLFPQISHNSFIPANQFDQIQIQANFLYLDFQILLLKFEDSLITMKKLRTFSNLGFFSNWLLNEKTAVVFLQMEEFEKGLEILEKSFIDARKIFGVSTYSFIGKTAFLTSFFHIQKNRFSDAINVLEIAYSSLKKGKKSAIFSQIIYTLGLLYREVNKLDRSFKCFRRIQDNSLDFWIENSQISRIFCETLGMLYIQRHEFHPAIELLEKALEIYKLRFTNLEKSEKYANILNSLGMCYFELKSPEKALQFYEKSIELKGNLFSQDYEKKGETMSNLALIYFELLDYKKAIEMNLKALEIYSQSKEKRNFANSLNNLGLAYKSSLDFEKAIINMKKALDLFESEYGKTDVLCGKTLNNIGMTYYDKGEIFQAIEYCEKALEIYKISSQDQQIIARVLNNIGVLYTGNKDYEKAKEYYAKAVEIKKNSDAKNFVDIADSLSNLANIHHLLKEFEKAKALYKEIIEIRVKYLGETHKSSLETMRNFAECLFEMEEFKEAVGFFNKVRYIKQKLEGGFEKSIEKATIMGKIACCLVKMGNFVEALLELRVAIEIERENNQGNKKNLAGYLKEYGLALKQAERYKECVENLKEAEGIWKKIKDKDEKEIKLLKEEIKKTKALMKVKDKEK